MSVSHPIERRSTNLLVLAVAGFLLIASVTGAVLLTQGKSEVARPEDFHRAALAQNTAESVESLVRQSVADQRTFIDRQKQELLTGDAKTVTQLLRDFTEDASIFSSEALILRGDTVFATWPENPAVIGRNLLRDFEHLREAEESAEPSVSGAIPSAIFFEQPAVEIASPVLGETKRVEAIFASGFLVEGSSLQTYLESLNAGPDGFFFIVDKDFVPIAYPREVGPDFDLIEQDKVQAHAPIPTAGWTLTVRQDRNLFQEPVTTERWKFLGLIAALIIAVAILGYLAHRFLRSSEARKIELAESARRLAEVEREMAVMKQERSRDLEHVNQLDVEKDEFVSMVSHELRGPLTIMKGWIEMILEGRFGDLTEEQHGYLTISHNNIERMFALVEDLLTVSKAESGRLDMIPEEVSVSEVIGDLAANVEQIVEDRGLRLSVEVDSDLPTIEADRHRIEQVITNFLSNAIKFTEEGGTVSMKARSEDGGIVAEVSDTGLGIPANEQSDLFKKFFRTSNVKGKVPGTGLGLAISKAIVESHGGRVGLQSVEGEGSTFWMWLPRTFPRAAPSGN